MPRLTVSGTQFPGVLDAKVLISLETATGAPAQIPVCQFVVELRPTNNIVLAQWALAPNSPNRFKKVDLEMLDSNGNVNKKWTMNKAYVSRYEEYEPSPDAPDASLGSRISLLITGVLASNTNYDGRNVLDVVGGAP